MSFLALRAFVGLALCGLSLLMLAMVIVAAFNGYSVTITTGGPIETALDVLVLVAVGLSGLLVAIVELANLVHVRIGL